MNDYLLIAENKTKDIRLFVEDAGSELGYYLYVMIISTGEIYKDYLCDNMEEVFQVAQEDHGINLNDFKPPKAQ